MEKKVFEPEQVVTVLTDQPINGGLLDYIVSENSVSLGQFVEVPIGKRSVVGVIWNKPAYNIERVKLKYIRRILDIPFMQTELKNYEKAINSYKKVQKIYPSMQAPKVMIPRLKELIKGQSI